MAVTRFGLEGYGVRRAGSFAGKTPSASDLNAPARRRHSAITAGRQRVVAASARTATVLADDRTNTVI